MPSLSVPRNKPSWPDMPVVSLNCSTIHPSSPAPNDPRMTMNVLPRRSCWMLRKNWGNGNQVTIPISQHLIWRVIYSHLLETDPFNLEMPRALPTMQTSEVEPSSRMRLFKRAHTHTTQRLSKRRLSGMPLVGLGGNGIGRVNLLVRER